MFHHDHREFRVAVDETAKKFQAELNAKIAASRGSAIALIDRIQREIPSDRIAASRALQFVPATNGLAVDTPDGEHQPLHRHALSQVADRAGIPDLFVTRLLAKPWGAELLADNLNHIFKREDPRRLLLRSVKDEVRGVLSDTYRRLDSRPIIEAFATACQQIGVEPIEGVGGDLRFCVRAVLPVVFRPGGKEIIAFGIEISNSDFGAGALSVRALCMRIICSNMARLDEELRRVHLGRRLDDSIEFSRETYELDTRAMSSAVRDIVLSSMAPAKLNAQVAQIERSLTEKVDFKAALAGLPRMGLLKKEVEAVHDVLSSGGIEQLPPTGNTKYRLSNAISWIAKSADTAERRLDLEAIAGSMLIGTKSTSMHEAA